ncbi:MAG: hypothetical protein Q9188_006468 [Gyalolechia gomerana]
MSDLWQSICYVLRVPSIKNPEVSIIQAIGASIASGNDKSEDIVLLGLHVYMGGVGLQQFFVFEFLYIAFRFQQQIKTEILVEVSRTLFLLYAQYTVLILITVRTAFADLSNPLLTDRQQVRIIFRLGEYAQGLDSSVPNLEAYQYVFDTLPMLVALVVYNLGHPGRIMPDKESDFPNRKERKNYFKGNSSGNNRHSLSPTQPAGSASMPEEDAF